MPAMKIKAEQSRMVEGGVEIVVVGGITILEKKVRALAADLRSRGVVFTLPNKPQWRYFFDGNARKDSYHIVLETSDRRALQNALFDQQREALPPRKK